MSFMAIALPFFLKQFFLFIQFYLIAELYSWNNLNQIIICIHIVFDNVHSFISGIHYEELLNNFVEKHDWCILTGYVVRVSFCHMINSNHNNVINAVFATFSIQNQNFPIIT